MEGLARKRVYKAIYTKVMQLGLASLDSVAPLHSGDPLPTSAPLTTETLHFHGTDAKKRISTVLFASLTTEILHF